jgi:hypothetical protein
LFLSSLPGLTNAYEKFDNSYIHQLMSHNQKGTLRPESSTGYKFNVRRKELAKHFEDEILEWLDEFDCSIPVYAVAFLKDEMREMKKDTRSIMVFQIYLWFIYQRHLGCLLQFLADSNPTSLAFGHRDDHLYFTDKLRHFKDNVTTHSIDLRKQDSRFGAWWVRWFMDLLFTRCNWPYESRQEIDWCMNEAFFEKKLVDIYGNVFTFENGELSGFPGTIVFNSFYSLFFFCVADALMVLNHNYSPDSFRYPLCVLGDDVLTQFKHFGVYEGVVAAAGHELTHEEHTELKTADFLSYKFTKVSTFILPYYCNLPKMYASLRYANGGRHDAYFGKVCSFINLLRFAPKGSQEYIELTYLVELAQKMIEYYGPEELPTAAFLDPEIARRALLGLDTTEEGDLIKYHSLTLTSDKMTQPKVSSKTLKNRRKRARKREKKRAQKASGISRSHTYGVKVERTKVPRNPSPYIANRVPKNVTAAAQNAAENMLDPDEPYRIARVGATKCTAKCLQESFTLQPNPSGYNAVLIQADPVAPVKHLVQSEVQQVWHMDDFEQMHHISSASAQKRICISHKAINGTGGTLKSSFFTDPPNYFHYELSNVIGQGARYMGGFSGNAVFTVHNRGNSARSITPGAVCWTSKTTSTVVVAAQSAVAAGATVTMTVPLDAATYAVALWFSIAEALNTDLDIRITQLTSDGGYHWVPLEFMNSTTMQTVKASFESCSQYAVTGLSGLLSNYQPELYKNGRVSRAELPPECLNLLPGDPTLMFEFIAALPTDNKDIQAAASEGAHYSWAPSEFKQVEFQSRVMDEQAMSHVGDSKPCGLFVWQLGTDQLLNGAMQFLVKMNLEMITTQRGEIVRNAPDDVKNFTRWIQYCAKIKRVGSNKNHVQRIASSVGAFLARPDVQKTAAKLVKQGIPILASMLI